MPAGGAVAEGQRQRQGAVVGFEGAGYLPAGAGEVYGADVFGFGHDWGWEGCEGSIKPGLFFTCIEVRCYEVGGEDRYLHGRDGRPFYLSKVSYCRQTGGVTLT